MGKSWLMCVLLGTLAWGQAQPGTPSPARPSQNPAAGNGAQAAAAAPDASDSVAQDAAVLTITGVCKPQPRPAAAKAGAAPAKTPAATTKPAECKTVITRAEFEKLAASLSPHMTPQLKKQLSSVYPNMLAMAQAAQKQGLDKSAHFEAQMKFARLQILGKELRDQIMENAAKVPDAEVQEYYQQNLASYQQFNLDRVFVPHFRRPEPEAKSEEKEDKDEKATPEQQKVKAEQELAKATQTEQDEAKLAESLRTRAAAGEDFAKLQKEAYDAAGMKMDAPTINLPKVRRNTLPPGQVAVFDLKEGEVSQVIADSGGRYIYRVKAIEEMPLDDTLKNEIHGMLQGQRQRAGLEKYQNSYTVVTNEEYFGAPAPAGARPGAPPMRMPPNRAPMPAQPGAQPHAQPATPPAAQPPAAQPN
jgi:hypothetical protein